MLGESTKTTTTKKSNKNHYRNRIYGWLYLFLWFKKKTQIKKHVFCVCRDVCPRDMNVRKTVKSHSSCLPRGSWSLVVRLEGKWLSLCITSWTWVSCFPGIVETVLLCNPGWPQSWLRPVSGSQVCTITSDKCFTSPVSKCWVRTYFHSQDKKLVLTTQEHQICLQVTHPITSLPDDNPQWPPG